MNRRHFCKMASLAVGALGLSGLDAEAAVLSTRRIREAEPLPLLPADSSITVERCECYVDLQSLYLDDPEEGACRAFRAGENFRLSAGSGCPKEFCPKAWRAVCESIMEDGGCAATIRNGLKLVTCPDGTRPVVFRIELNPV